MADRLTAQQRSELMSKIKGKDTAPEMIVRRIVHGLGFRYRLHRKNLPGKPDLAFSARRKVIFVHGCFWHGHGCKIGKLPKSRPEFWRPKIEGNRRRDEATLAGLARAGWVSLIVWQCETKDLSALRNKIVEFLTTDAAPSIDSADSSL